MLADAIEKNHFIKNIQLDHDNISTDLERRLREIAQKQHIELYFYN